MSGGMFLISLGLTLLLEIPFAYWWGLRSRHDVELAFLVNVLTNPVVVLLNAAGVPILLLEVSAVIAEGALYRSCGKDVRRPMLLALCANAFSFIAGELLQQFF